MKAPYHYTECGLNDVYLVSGYTLSKDGILLIDDVHGLHRCIGQHLIRRFRSLRGQDIRFIRHFMDLSQKTFGEMLGVDYQTVLRWEMGKNRIPKTADRLLRVIFDEYLDPASNARDLINTLSDIDNDRSDRPLELVHKKQWRLAG